MTRRRTLPTRRTSLSAANRPSKSVGRGGSDDASFKSGGIPIGGFTTGISDCIHEPCDDLSNVDPATETSSANTILDVTWALATSSHAATTPQHRHQGDRS
ncbi:M28 family peptidase [Streptomyces sp. NPDC046984]|uniref:M28 family peptidase n=1 Tax=Streptomyces sp. NPDC046984 TaxID=3155138 RepID=UPI00340C65F9